MIARIWQGKTQPGMGASYLEYLEKTGLPEYRETPGFRGVFVLTREDGAETEVLLLSLWEDMEAVRRFAGPEPDKAVYYADDARYFPESEFRPFLKHYAVVEGPVTSAPAPPARGSRPPSSRRAPARDAEPA